MIQLYNVVILVKGISTQGVMKICYQIKNGIEYAKTEASSYSDGDKDLKKDVI